MFNRWMSWLPSWRTTLMPPSPAPAVPAPACQWLEAALRRASLGTLLHSPGGITLLAPTDAALDAAGLRPAEMPPASLQRWLASHLTLGSPRDDGLLPLLDGNLLRRAEQGAGWVDAQGRPVRLLGRPVLRRQLRVQPIDRALTGPVLTLWQQVSSDPRMSRLADATARCGLHHLLSCNGPFTLFAPDDAGLDRAAARLGWGSAALWHDIPRLRALVLGHIVPGRWASSDLPWAGRLRTLGDHDLHLQALGRIRSGDLSLPLARGSDQPCGNGLLHRLDEVLLPPTG